LPDNLPPFPGHPVLPCCELFIAFKRLRHLLFIQVSHETKRQIRKKFTQRLDFKRN